MPRKTTLQLAGLAEAAEILEVSRPRLSALSRRSSPPRPGELLAPAFPAPVAVLRCGPIWRIADVKAYARQVERRRPMTWWERLKADERAEKRARRSRP